MGYWLVKSEPYKYAWEQLLQDGRTYWDGVRNYQARNNVQAMKNGDPVLFYHSNGERANKKRARANLPIFIEKANWDKRSAVRSCDRQRSRLKS